MLLLKLDSNMSFCFRISSKSSELNLSDLIASYKVFKSQCHFSITVSGEERTLFLILTLFGKCKDFFGPNLLR